MVARRAVVAALATLLPLSLVGCSGQDAGQRTVTVFAAASLQDVLGTIAQDFEHEHPGVRVGLVLDGSANLVTQLAEGARADVLATADESTMARAVSDGSVIAPPTIVATNVLTLAVAPGNPWGITGLDSSLAGRKLVVCADGVPCGSATARLASARGITLRPVSTEQSVTGVLAKVTSGEADAGVVYLTDAKRAGAAVTAVPVDGAPELVNRYPMAVTANAAQPDLARDFVAAVADERGRRVLADAGFGTP